MKPPNEIALCVLDEIWETFVSTLHRTNCLLRIFFPSSIVCMRKIPVHWNFKTHSHLIYPYYNTVQEHTQDIVQFFPICLFHFPFMFVLVKSQIGFIRLTLSALFFFSFDWLIICSGKSFTFLWNSVLKIWRQLCWKLQFSLSLSFSVVNSNWVDCVYSCYSQVSYL